MTQHITQEQAFEQWYVENVFNLEVNPIWPRDYGLQRKAWHAAIQWDRDQRAKELPVLLEPVAWLANYGGNVYTEAQLKQAVRDAQGVNSELVDCLSELCDIVEGVVEDKSSVGSLIDSFTTQPARTTLSKYKGAK